MLAVLARKNPTARHHQAVATALPVEGASLDAVLVADAWHWFDTDATIMELAACAQARRMARGGLECRGRAG